MAENSNRSVVLRPASAVAARSNPNNVMVRMTRGVLAEVLAGNAVVAELLTQGSRLHIKLQQATLVQMALCKFFTVIFDEGITGFSDASLTVLADIEELVGKYAADAVSIHHLQCAYISLMGNYPAARLDDIMAVAKFRSKDQFNTASQDTQDSMTPEQEQQLLPVLTRLFDAAFRIGYLSFKQSAMWALDTIARHPKLGADAAAMITVDHLQGAYITMSALYRNNPEYTGAAPDSKKDVAAIESKDEISQEPEDDASQQPRLESDRPTGQELSVEGPDAGLEQRRSDPGDGSAGGQAA
jgi:hypothetical protein